ncbi:hypothetical protein [Flavilitoribacter nigricans]|uniref:hypothetical protein n=1 Tax=Flavilitoribacter nigricans TaxID=70997 RepID=UPI0014741A29|nr:hypothetical protein [Flavilitoribacter nigricans]
MNLPKQAVPVQKASKVNYRSNGMQLSSIPCDICMAGCSMLTGIAKTLCIAACNATVC